MTNETPLWEPSFCVSSARRWMADKRGNLINADGITDPPYRSLGQRAAEVNLWQMENQHLRYLFSLDFMLQGCGTWVGEGERGGNFCVFVVSEDLSLMLFYYIDWSHLEMKVRVPPFVVVYGGLVRRTKCCVSMRICHETVFSAVSLLTPKQ